MNESPKLPVVNSYNEWDTLEEVIVGNVDGATVPDWHESLQATMPSEQADFFKLNKGKLFPEITIANAKKEIDEFIHILKSEGITVKRPDITDYREKYKLPYFQASISGLYNTMPRDVLLVIGNEIIEAPMPWPSRYFESNSYRSLIKEYYKRGAKWTAAPKPVLDKLYDGNSNNDDTSIHYAINEYEPVFDAADFIRCGKDIFVLKSNVTNDFGIDWLQRHIGDDYKIHKIQSSDEHPMHIDTTFMPLSPGKLMVHPDRMKKIPDQFKSWDILYAPKPVVPNKYPLYMSSKWLTMNILMLDTERVIVPKYEYPLIKALKRMGMKPIPCSIYNVFALGGGFHCITCDVRRKGELKSYF